MKLNATTLVAVATAGILTGFTAPRAWAGDAATGSAPATEQHDKNTCNGKDGCKGMSAEHSSAAADKDKNSCKGANGCGGKAEKNSCKGEKNSCKGKDGCKGNNSCNSKPAPTSTK